MPTTIKLCNMSAKYLVDYLSHSGWARNHDDVYRSGQLLAEVMPRFVDADTATAQESAAADPLWDTIRMIDGPVASAMNADGSTDWSRMSRAEADDFRAKVKAHNNAFLEWCRRPLPRHVVLSDKQLDVCQRAVKYYSPRSDEDRLKDREKNIPDRPALPNNEFTFQLLRELKLGAE